MQAIGPKEASIQLERTLSTDIGPEPPPKSAHPTSTASNHSSSSIPSTLAPAGEAASDVADNAVEEPEIDLSSPLMPTAPQLRDVCVGPSTLAQLTSLRLENCNLRNQALESLGMLPALLI